MDKAGLIKKFMMILIDIVLINMSYIFALYFRFAGIIPYNIMYSYENCILVISFFSVAIFSLFGLYNSLWKYAGIDELLIIVGGCIFSGMLTAAYIFILKIELSYGVCLLAGILSIIFVGGFRISFKISDMLKGFFVTNNTDFKNVMIIGAGKIGAMLIKEMKTHPEMNYKPCILIDDDNEKLGKKISGIKVSGNRNTIIELTRKNKIDTIVLAIQSITFKEKLELIEICKKTKCKLQIMPSIHGIIDGKITLKEICDVDIEDLLQREPVKLDMSGIEEYIKNKIVLVTGGGGSIGSELCRQIAKFNPEKLLILDVYENNAYDLQNQLKYKYPNLHIKVIIANVTDKDRMENIFRENRPHIVFHAAAHKHVPLMEDNPQEAIKNNIFGTLITTECANKYEAERFVLISTDKAVNPTNIMGATKRVCEMIIQSLDKISKTQFAAVRFGNVLGSNGSVIPLFKKQIAHGGPVTLTNKYITRFFMTIPEAAQLVLQAGGFAKGGEIFILDMGQPIKIYDLACDLIRLSGFEPYKDIKIEITGLRPGEKLYEEVLMQDEGLNKTAHEKIFIAKPTYDCFDILKQNIEILQKNVEEKNIFEIINDLKNLVPTYKKFNYDEVATSEENGGKYN